MSSAEKSDVIESLLSLLKENEKRVDDLGKKMEENTEVFRSLHSLLEENEIRFDTLEKRIEIIELKNKDSGKIVKEIKSKPEKKSVPRNILVVDDDTKLTSGFKLILESAGYNVEVANTGFTAHILVTKNYYDLVILDWHLHDVFGYQIADTIEKRHNDTKIIFITGYSYILDEYERKNEILLKPIEPDFLLETVAKSLKEKGLNAREQIQKYREELGIEQDTPAAPE